MNHVTHIQWVNLIIEAQESQLWLPGGTVKSLILGTSNTKT